MPVKLKNGGLQEGGADRWYVTDGMNAVGPVQRTLLVRGIEAGRVPLDSFVRHEGWKVWRPLADFAESDGVPSAIPTMPHPLSSLLEHERAIADGSLNDSGEYPDRATIEVRSEGAPSTDHLPVIIEEASVEVPTQVSRDLLGGDRPTLASYLEDEETKVPLPPRSPSAAAKPSAERVGSSPLVNDDEDGDEGKTSPSVRPPRPVSPSKLKIEGLESAADLSDGLLLLLNAAVLHTRAEAGLLHRMSDDGSTVVCANGPNMVEALGLRTRLLDPALVAAAGGSAIVAETAPGPAGEATLNRLRKMGLDAEGAAMLPIRPKGRLLGFMEIGKAQRFTFQELAVAEALVESFVLKAEASGWAP